MSAEAFFVGTGLLVWLLVLGFLVFANRFNFVGIHPRRGLTERQRVKLTTGHRVYRYLPRSSIVEHGDWVVKVRARTPSIWGRVVGHPISGPCMCFYVGHSRRGAFLNGGTPARDLAKYGPHDLVIVDASDFLTAYRGKLMRVRSWDRAVVVSADYTGPARIVRDVDQAASRRDATLPEARSGGQVVP